MQEIGEVIEKRNNKALVRIIRHSACSKCKQNCLLASDNHEIEEMEVEVSNPVGAGEGKRVKLEMEERPLLYASLLIYLLPPLGLIFGYFLGSWLAAITGFFSGQGAGITGSVVLLLLSFAAIGKIDSYLSGFSAYHPRITEIIE